MANGKLLDPSDERAEYVPLYGGGPGVGAVAPKRPAAEWSRVVDRAAARVVEHGAGTLVVAFTWDHGQRATFFGELPATTSNRAAHDEKLDRCDVRLTSGDSESAALGRTRATVARIRGLDVAVHRHQLRLEVARTRALGVMGACAARLRHRQGTSRSRSARAGFSMRICRAYDSASDRAHMAMRPNVHVAKNGHCSTLKSRKNGMTKYSNTGIWTR